MASDLEQLVSFGFNEEKAKLALKKSGGLQPALDWLEKNADKSVEQLNEEDSTLEPPALNPGEEAKSLICDDCGKKFRSVAQAEFHASKTDHENFSESTEEIKPLTDEEKKAKLEELRIKLAEKRAGVSEQDKEDKRKNEEIRKKATKESHDIKEQLQNQERIKEAQAKRREKKEDDLARKKILQQIETDKAERKRKADLEKAQRAGGAVYAEPEPEKPAAAPVAPKAAADYKEARLSLRTSAGNKTMSFPVETTLFEVAHALGEDIQKEVKTFTTTFPRKVYDSSDFGMTLKEAGMVPSVALIVGTN
ncbi:hypothetical protein EJ08DRAFT_165739 [Tothia fuscella]|uniref:UBX domain-containing protein 1 n=1 Tax=Tothia fuscella TaxID=1048955 RepID=A0A9P4TZW1_9PEZI|nr:hypothetical protein EJ08DRAFT_165739 [Tothia fuscella]